VSILLAIESGSRAWRFPSRDSDYDVRLIYVHRMEKYLSIEPPRDVIEYPVGAALDINGWDIRKALGLLVRSNAVVLEWLASHVRYREAETTVRRVRSLAEKACFLPALEYHYDRMARGSLEQIRSCGGSIPLKTYCYAFRPCLALAWIRDFAQPPPMDLPALLANSNVAEHVRKTVVEFVDHKAGTSEQSTTARIEIVDDFIANVLGQTVDRPGLPDRADIFSQANDLFRSIALRAN